MPQARLPDINTAFIKYRNEVSNGLKSGNYDSVFGALYAINALLPEEPIDPDTKFPKYRVVISDIDYKRLTKPTTYCKCYHCEKDSKYDDVVVFDMILPFTEQIVAQKKRTKAWVCPFCKKNCIIRPDDFTETAVKEPSFIGVVPKPPRRQEGLMDRSMYHRKVVQWSWTTLDELEAKMAQFRDDNWTKNSEYKDDEDDSYDTDDEI